MRWIIYSIFFLFIFSSCEKHKYFNKLAGTYDIYKYEEVYYNVDGGVDSTFTYDDLGTLGLSYNSSDVYNNIQRDWDFDPRSWFPNGVGGTAAVGWYVDEINGETLTFFSSDDYFDYYVSYQIKNKVGKKMEWTTVRTNSQGGISIKETLYLKKN